MTRRAFMASAAAAASALAAGGARTSLGIATTCFMTTRRFRDAYDFLEYAVTIGAGGVQTGLASFEPDYLRKLRKRADDQGMYLEVVIGLPQEANSERFERTVAAASELGARCVRANCGGRRYEDFSLYEDWKQFAERSKAGIARGLAIAEKHKVPFAIENHKDWLLEQQLEIYQRYSSEWLGACLDTGNNISLLDDPMEVVEKLAPYAFSTHLKDMAVEEYAGGFLLSEVVLGQGMLDIPKIVATVKKARPATRFTLEMITRDPLKVPCLTDRYWATFPERRGSALARTLRMVRANKPRAPLPRMEGRSAEDRTRYEEENVKLCLDYARTALGLV